MTSTKVRLRGTTDAIRQGEIGYRCNAWRTETLEDFVRCGWLEKVKVAHLNEGSILC